MPLMEFLKQAAVVLVCAFGVAACTPGYMKVEDLNRREQGPDHGPSRCRDLGMDRGPRVWVSTQLPVCVCPPRPATPPPAPMPPTPPTPPTPPANVQAPPGAADT